MSERNYDQALRNALLLFGVAMFIIALSSISESLRYAEDEHKFPELRHLDRYPFKQP